MNTEISPLELNELERDLTNAAKFRHAYVEVDPDTLRRLVEIAKVYTPSSPDSELEIEIERLEEAVEDLKWEIKDLTSDLNASDSTIASLEKEILTLEDQLALASGGAK